MEAASQYSGYREGCADRVIAIILYWGGGMVVGMFAGGALGAVLSYMLPGAAGVMVIAGMAVGAAAGGVCLYRRDWFLREAGRRAAAARTADLLDGMVEVLEAEVHDAVLVEELEDEGPSAFLDAGDGQVLALHGQWLRDYLYEDWEVNPARDADGLDAADEEENGEAPFPSRRLRITRTAHSGIIMDFQCLGERFPPSRVRGPLTTEDYWPGEVEVLPIRFDRLDEELRRLARERGRAGWAS